ncbi:MAG: GGDEF domain-containing protein [Rhodospirillaceae bacterium]
MTSEAAKTRADENARALRSARSQRNLLLGGSVAYMVIAGAIYPSQAHALRFWIFGAVVLAVIAFSRVRMQRARYPALLLPLSAAAIFSAANIANALSDPARDLARFALMSGLLAPYLVLLAPGRRSALTAIAAMTIVTSVGAFIVGRYAASSDVAPALAFLLAGLALALGVSHALEHVRGEANILRGELERRASSDEITGVSSRAHVSVLAQNEFARARRYGEPFSCLTIEIDEYERLLGAHGRDAGRAIVQVFTGYCVVVMRHCDSFGRLMPSRFLALLPETPAAGAQTLATRMCRDLAALDVAFAGDKLRFTVSIGVTEMHAVDRSAGDMLRRGVQGLADAQEGGGNGATIARIPIRPPPEGEPPAAPEATTS